MESLFKMKKKYNLRIEHDFAIIDKCEMLL